MPLDKNLTVKSETSEKSVADNLPHIIGTNYRDLILSFYVVFQQWSTRPHLFFLFITDSRVYICTSVNTIRRNNEPLMKIKIPSNKRILIRALLALASAQKNRTLKSYLFRGTRYTLVYEICAQIYWKKVYVPNIPVCCVISLIFFYIFFHA